MLYSIVQDKDLAGDSKNWANWMSVLAWNTCKYCARKHGTIISVSELMYGGQHFVMYHLNCQCTYVYMRTKPAGTATSLGRNGADYYLFWTKKLPGYYISKKQERQIGWVDWKGNFDTIFPEKMIGGDIYLNSDEKLPIENGRVWYEADINYTKGYRNGERVVYSSDGLIFVTYDHYKTFYEITK